MAKTRNQTLKSSVREEACKEESNRIQLLHHMKSKSSITNSNKITKRNASKPGRTSITEPEVKLEVTSERKPMKRPLIERLKDRWVTKEKLIKLINYVENEKMSLNAASRKADVGQSAALKYYHLYKSDPEHKIPIMGHDRIQERLYTTNQKIETIIRCIVENKMTIPETAKKTNTHSRTVARYYAKYMNDPNRKIPVRNIRNKIIEERKIYTQEQVEKLIGCIYNDNTTIAEAARRVQMSWSVAYRFYKIYKNDPEHRIPNPDQPSKKSSPCTTEQIKALISHIVHDKMTIKEAASKAKMSLNSSKKYYSQYLLDPNHEIPIPGKATLPLGRRFTQDQINNLIGYIVNDGMFIKEASIKANMSSDTAARYYCEFLEDPNHKIPQPKKYSFAKTKLISYEQVEKMISYIVDDKMTIREAGEKTNIGRNTAAKYYRMYLKDPNHTVPVPTRNSGKLPTSGQVKQLFEYILGDKLSVNVAAEKVGIGRQTAYNYHAIYKKGPEHITKQVKNSCTYKQIKELIGYIENDKMSLKDAAIKARMITSSADKYYKIYKDDPEHKIPLPTPIRYSTLKTKFAENLQVIADIYNKNQNKIKSEE